MILMKKTAVLALALSGLSSFALADETPYACKKLDAGAKFHVTLKPGSSLADLAVWVMGFTCKTVVFPDQLATTQVKLTIVSGAEMTAKEALQLFSDSLSLYGLTVTDKGNTLLVNGGNLCAATTTATSTTAPDTSPDPDLDKWIKKTDDTHYEISRQLIDKYLADPTLAARQARMVPSISDGKANGFKLYAIRPTSLFARVGLQNGDTITAINGQDFNSPDKALEVYSKVKDADKLTIDVLRRGQPMALELRVVKK
jgi:hypothetical protein